MFRRGPVPCRVLRAAVVAGAGIVKPSPALSPTTGRAATAVGQQVIVLPILANQDLPPVQLPQAGFIVTVAAEPLQPHILKRRTCRYAYAASATSSNNSGGVRNAFSEISKPDENPALTQNVLTGRCSGSLRSGAGALWQQPPPPGSQTPRCRTPARAVLHGCLPVTIADSWLGPCKVAARPAEQWPFRVRAETYCQLSPSSATRLLSRAAPETRR